MTRSGDRPGAGPAPHTAIAVAVAVAETLGPATGFALLEEVVVELDGYHLLHASRGSMLESLGRPHEAAEAYDRAAALARTESEVSFLSLRRTQLSVDVPGGSGQGLVAVVHAEAPG